MPQVAFVLSQYPHYPRRELAETLRYELELQGVPASLHLGAFPPPEPGLVYVLVDPAAFVASQGWAALPPALAPRTIFVSEDRPPVVDAPENLELLRRGAVVFVLDQTAVVALHRQGIPARLLKPGYSPSLDHFDNDAERPIDVMFLGTRSHRRTRHLARAARVLSRHNCLLQVSGEESSVGDTSSFLARNRWPLLARTKVFINLHSGEDHRFEWRTALDAIHAGAVVVTEHASGIAPLVAGEHLLVAGPDALPFVAEAVLRDPERLAALRAAAYERLSAWIPFALSVAVLRAAVVEVVGEPVPLEAMAPSASPGPAPISPAPPPGADEEARLAAMTRELAQMHDELLEVHHQLHVLQDATANGDGASGVELAHESPAWVARRRSRVTVLTTLTGDGDGLRETLDSLLISRMRDFELVLVVGADGAEARRVARRWLIEHPRIAGRLITSRSPLGIGAGRNAGLEFSRSEYCLVLDPGQQLYSRALDVLAGTLDSMPDEVAFVYPMVEVIGDVDAFVAAGGDYLLNYFGWDPGRLRFGNYVHAPALVRRRHVREIGGYVTDAGLAGLEDYDLWCRMAERDWRGQLIPQELARRAASGSSSVLSALHPRPGIAMDLLRRRAPALMRPGEPA